MRFNRKYNQILIGILFTILINLIRSCNSVINGGHTQSPNTQQNHITAPNRPQNYGINYSIIVVIKQTNNLLTFCSIVFSYILFCSFKSLSLQTFSIRNCTKQL